MSAILGALAPAKINWTLEVLGRRPDGYHEIASVMSTVSLCDELTLTRAGAWRVSVDAPEPLKSELETGDNLVTAAIAVLAAEAAHANGVGGRERPPVWPPPPAYGPPAHVHLLKRIPAAAGLGGGSSDAAAMLRLLRAAWRGETGALSRQQLDELATRLGSDVPFFLQGGTQFARGRGELLQPVDDPIDQWVVVLVPSISIERKTARLYRLLTPHHYTDGSRSEALAARLRHPQPHRLTEADLYNVFDSVADLAFPRLPLYRDALEQATGARPHLCGAGPALFALCADRAAARRAVADVRQLNVMAVAATVLNRTSAAHLTGDSGGHNLDRCADA